MNDEDKRNLEELERELRRVGITWDAFAELCRLNAPNEPVSPDGSFSMALDFPKTAAVLHTLPDGAGQAAFIAAWIERLDLPGQRRRLEAAMLAESRKRGIQSSGPGGAGA